MTSPRDGTDLLPEVTADEVAFLNLSGGSTGVPKLIPRTHDDYLHSVRESADICGLTTESVYMATLPVSHNFTLSSPGVLGALHAGARIVLAPAPSPDVAFPLIARERVTITGVVPPIALLWMVAGHELVLVEDYRDARALVRTVRAERLDYVDVTPSYLAELIALGLFEEHRPSIVVFGGEAVSAEVWRRLGEYPDVLAVNTYGPTEYTVDATQGVVSAGVAPHIGYPVGDTRCLVLDAWLRLVPSGAPGELYLAG
ncbi:AMP-binding protein, partial [Kibdelosporangium lantanae]